MWISFFEAFLKCTYPIHDMKPESAVNEGRIQQIKEHVKEQVGTICGLERFLTVVNITHSLN